MWISSNAFFCVRNGSDNPRLVYVHKKPIN